MKTKKICTAGYSCGLTCINREKSCSKELTGQSIQLCSQLANIINDKPIEKQEKPAKKAQGTSVINDKPIEKQEKPAKKARGTSDHNVTKTRIGEEGHYQEMQALLGTDKNRTGDIIDAISEFCGEKYGDFRVDERSGKSNKSVDAINEYLAKAPTYEGAIYRGIGADASKFAKGDSMELDAMSSFSSSPEVASNFAVRGDGDMIIFKVNSNKSGCSIKQLSSIAEEDEVLVPKNTKYRIVSKNDDGLSVLITLEEI